MKRRFELDQGSFSEFWAVEVKGEDLKQRYGRIGAASESNTRYFASSTRAKAVAEELIAEKIEKGYREVEWVVPGAWDTKHPPFVVRSFEACVADFASLQKGKVKKEPKRAENVGELDIAVAFKNPTDPKFTSNSSAIAEDTLYLSRGDGKLDLISNPELLFNDASGLDNPDEGGMPALHLEWQTSGEGSWAGEQGSWIVLSGDNLYSEHDSDAPPMSMILAAWRVEEGVALAAWKGSGKTLAIVMGLSGGWPSQGWESINVWLGEG